MFICAVYILGRHLDGALHRGANRENFLSSFGSGIAESVQWFAQIGFHLNNFIAAQVSPFSFARVVSAHVYYYGSR
jgi:hypothetical protein